MPAVHHRRGGAHATGRRRWLARGIAAVVAALSMAPLPALAQTSTPASATATSTTSTPAVQAVCGKPAPGHFGCFALRRTDTKHGLGVRVNAAGQDVTPAGYSPADLRSAYNLPANGGAGATIAVVDAYDDPTAEQDMAVYRQQYGLPACTSDTGCFRKVDQRGGANYPQVDLGWADEISLDLDMISAIAPQANIILVEADSANDSDLGTAENMAVSLGAQYVSNSWGGYSDTATNLAEDQAYYNHPGTAIVFSSGDNGYGVTYPAASPNVTSVGGTSLTQDNSSRGWTESVWNSATLGSNGTWNWGAPASGCSTVEPKPSYQTDTGCSGRSVADVSAVADPMTGVAVYDSQSDTNGWNVFGGTSASAPIITGVYALAGQPTAGTYPSSYPYETPSALNDVTTGDDASCAAQVQCGFGTTPVCTPSYECQAGPGYDGPTGLGTPDGVAAFTSPGPHGVVTGTVTDSSTSKPLAGATVTLGDHSTTTDQAGGYRLDVPVGSYDLSVSDFGYATKDLGTVSVADGTTLTENAAITAVPSATVSGTVRDGGGHGWGLYAKITVDGVPGSTFTDPATGHYSLSLPQGASYTLHATALYPGYQQGSAQVDATGATASADLSLPLDGASVLPPGYRIDYGGGEDQTFDTASAPSGWTVKNNTSWGGWNFNDPLNRGNQTGGTGHFAEVDDFAQGWSSVDTELISPSYDFSSDKSPELDFDTALPSLYRLNGLTADVDVSTDNGATWTNVWEQTGVVSGPAHESISLAAYGGSPSLRVRFHFTGSLTGIWEVDDVQIGSHALQEVPGGLLVGHVRDANTGAGVLGAVVSSVATPDNSARVVATPDDPAQGGGLYWLFSPSTGSQQFSAGLPAFGYPAVTSSATVTTDAVTTADFALHPAQLQFSKPGVGATVAWGTQKTVTVQVRNTGGSPATISLGEDGAPAPSAAASGAPLQRVHGTQTPMGIATQVATGSAPASSAGSDAAAGGEAWQSLTNLPLPNYGGVAAEINGTLYTGLGETPGGTWSTAFYSYDPATASWAKLASPATSRYAPAWGVIRGKLYVVGGRDAAGNGIAGGEVYDPATNTWSSIASAPYAYGGEGMAVAGDKLYVLGGCNMSDGCGNTHVQVYDPATDTWSLGPDYPQPVSYLSCGSIDGVIYCAGGAYQPADGTPTDIAAGYSFDPAKGTWQRIADAPTDFWGAASTAAGGLLLSAGGQSIDQGVVTNAAYGYDPATNTWSSEPNLPGPVINAASAPGWYVIGGTNAYGALLPSVLELPGLAGPHGGVPWLSAQASSLTIAAGETATVTLTLDATAMGPADLGSHYAKLIVDSDTPYGSISLPVSMDVKAPGGWGELAGTVTATPGGKSTPVTGAVVTVSSKNGDTTLQTGPDGGYQLWLPVKDNPLTVSVTAPGYGTQTAKTTINSGHTVAADFTMSPQ